MAKWKDGKLDLGARMGRIVVAEDSEREWEWEWRDPGEMPIATGARRRTEAAACRAAESWMRRALKQAAKALAK